jgi:hypothetical protein
VKDSQNNSKIITCVFQVTYPEDLIIQKGFRLLSKPINYLEESL